MLRLLSTRLQQGGVCHGSEPVRRLCEEEDTSMYMPITAFVTDPAD